VKRKKATSGITRGPFPVGDGVEKKGNRQPSTDTTRGTIAAPGAMRGQELNDLRCWFQAFSLALPGHACYRCDAQRPAFALITASARLLGG
jgi:hypothetical protein